MPPKTLPIEDGSIQQAFCELDTQLDAWRNAMTQAQSALARIAEKPADQNPTSQESAPALVMVSAPEPGDEDSLSLAPTESLAATETEIAQDAVNTKGQTDQKAATVESAQIAEHVDTNSSQTEPIESNANQQNNDQALLASLDTEIAKAIRVRRRLDPNGKSVREFIEEYKLHGPLIRPDIQKKKSWWTKD